ncbi:MAG: hypothetical protein IT437_14170 [Phycisphaerales bacterium]|nr:hypothetical protein [Phycisphaerales bacterium]
MSTGATTIGLTMYLIVSGAAAQVAAPLDGKRHLIYLRGDVTGDGAVTTDDVQVVAARLGMIGASILDGDADGDGEVTTADGLVILPRMGLSIADLDWSNETDLNALSALVAAGHVVVDDPVSARQWNAVYHRTDRWPSYPQGQTAEQVHNTTVSAEWGEHGHTVSVSGAGGWPPTHFASFSQTWSTGHEVSSSSRYPPNHNYLISKGWQGHDATVSGFWPPNHERVRSDGWTYYQHDIAFSRFWPPSHSMAYSNGSWPQGHERSASRQAPPPVTEHQLEFSATWPPEPPAIWPPNHIPGVSATWPPSHATSTSYSWPPNHLKAASDTWSPGDHSNWPPSHVQDTSVAEP